MCYFVVIYYSCSWIETVVYSTADIYAELKLIQVIIFANNQRVY